MKDTLNPVILESSSEIIGYSPYRKAGIGEDYALAFLKSEVELNSKITLYPDVVSKVENRQPPIAPKEQRSIVSGADPAVGQIVYKIGATTGFTAGKVLSVTTKSFQVQYLAHFGIGGDFFSAKGDSGSPVFSIGTEGLTLHGIIAAVGTGEAGNKGSTGIMFSEIDKWLKGEFGPYTWP